MSRFYTVTEANARLPDLARLLTEMRSEGQQLAALQDRMAATAKKIKGNGYHNPAEDSLVSGIAGDLEGKLREGIEHRPVLDRLRHRRAGARARSRLPPAPHPRAQAECPPARVQPKEERPAGRSSPR